MDSCVPDTQREGYLTSKSANRRLRRPFVFLLPFLPGASQGAYNINFPEPVTPIARETLHIHNEFMLIITLLFVVVFAIMIYSMIRHRKSIGHEPSKFSGPSGKMQWFWALIPFAILLFIDFVLMGICEHPECGDVVVRECERGLANS